MQLECNCIHMDTISLINMSLRVCLQVLNVESTVNNLTHKYRMVKLVVYMCHKLL